MINMTANWLFEQLKDGEFAAEYLNAASEDDEPEAYRTALRKGCGGTQWHGHH
jgi:DNA-binding phage protein